MSLYRRQKLGTGLPQKAVLGLLWVLVAGFVIWPNLSRAHSTATTFRTGEHPGKTRFVLEFTAKPAYTIFTLDDPYRIVIDFDDIDWQVLVAGRSDPAPAGPPREEDNETN